MGNNRVTITVTSGADDGREFSLDKVPFMLGRHPDDDVFLPYDTAVSRHHARISREGSTYVIEDVGPQGGGSTNGTYINNSTGKITGRVVVSSGDLILLGGVWVRFQVK